MLVSFGLSNFRAFRDPRVLDLTRRGKRETPPNVTAIYGANASGKSSVVQGLWFVKEAVRNSFRTWEPGLKIYRQAFALDQASRDEPTEFEVTLVAGDGVMYRYGFQVTDDLFVGEWLYASRSSRETTLFERDASGIEFGKTFRGRGKDVRSALEGRPDALALSVSSQFGSPTTRPVFDWFSKQIGVFDARSHDAELPVAARMFSEDPQFAEELRALVQLADVGVTDVQLVPDEVPEEALERMRKDGVPAEVIERVRNRSTFELQHAGQGGSWALPFDDESAGTQAFLSFASIAIRALEHGRVMVIDELDTSLHPILCQRFVSLFRDPATNPNGAQLIMTTHDATLLWDLSDEHPALQREEVWIVEKDHTGAADVVALDRYRPSTTENLARGYLLGRYGGVPQPDLAHWIHHGSHAEA